jgi:hypothetical protein
MRLEEIDGAVEIDDRFVDTWYECLSYAQRQNIFDFVKDDGRVYAIVVEEGDDLEEIEDMWGEPTQEDDLESVKIKVESTPYQGGMVSGFFRNNEPKAPLNVQYHRVEPEVWQTPIREMFSGDYECESFLAEIWKQSVETLGGLEVSVIVDGNDNLYINHGSPGFVDYVGVDLRGMRIPIKCWIHTHPFGYAFWSGTDNRTLRNWRPILNSAIVLGKGEHLKWEKTENGERMTKVVNTDRFDL